MKTCPECGFEYSARTDTCPRCGTCCIRISAEIGRKIIVEIDGVLYTLIGNKLIPNTDEFPLDTS